MEHLVHKVVLVWPENVESLVWLVYQEMMVHQERVENLD